MTVFSRPAMQAAAPPATLRQHVIQKLNLIIGRVFLEQFLFHLFRLHSFCKSPCVVLSVLSLLLVYTTSQVIPPIIVLSAYIISLLGFPPCVFLFLRKTLEVHAPPLYSLVFSPVIFSGMRFHFLSILILARKICFFRWPACGKYCPKQLSSVLGLVELLKTAVIGVEKLPKAAESIGRVEHLPKTALRVDQDGLPKLVDS